jgi:hypothetical protein
MYDYRGLGAFMPSLPSSQQLHMLSIPEKLILLLKSFDEAILHISE